MLEQTLSDGSYLLQSTEEDSAEGFVHFFWLFPGMGLLFTDIHSPHWPNEELPGVDHEFQKGSFTINYSVSGSSKVRYDKERYIVQKQGDLSFSSRAPREDFFFPEGSYQSIQLLVNPSWANAAIGNTAPGGIADWFQLNFVAIARRYRARGRTQIGACPAMHRTLLTDLWAMYPFGAETPLLPSETLAAMRVQVLRLFQMLQYDAVPFTATQRPTFRSVQLEVAEQITVLILEDLRRDWTLTELSTELGHSESSLKRYFQQLYGCSVAKYQRNARMELAAEMLSNPEYLALSILDVALQVGYENQSKFAAVFKRHFGVSPLEYKKNAIL